MCNASVQFQMKIRKISRRRSRSPDYAELAHITLCQLHSNHFQWPYLAENLTRHNIVIELAPLQYRFQQFSNISQHFIIRLKPFGLTARGNKLVTRPNDFPLLIVLGLWGVIPTTLFQSTASTFILFAWRVLEEGTKTTKTKIVNGYDNVLQS